MSRRTRKAVALCSLASVYLLSSCTDFVLFSPARRAVLHSTLQIRAKEAAPPQSLAPGATRIRGGPEGTAFQISGNDYVTAAHVLSNFVGGRYTTPILVGADNLTVYAIDQVIGYDESRDIAVIRIKPGPRTVPAEPSATPPAEGNTVHFAGFVRVEPRSLDDYDGSVRFDVANGKKRQHEFMGVDPNNGRLMFSRAPSPGTSGGALLNADWQVIGMIQAADASRRFARAMPIDDVRKFHEGTAARPNAIVRSSSAYPVVAALECDSAPATDDDIPLPQSFEKFADAITSFKTAHVDDTLDRAVRARIASLASQPVASADRCDAPGGAGVENPIPWHSSPGDTTAPDAVIVRSFSSAPLTNSEVPLNDHLRLARFAQSEAWMAQLLDGKHLGGEIGAAEVNVPFTDGWKRTWQVRQWQLPEDDLVIVSLARTLPDGYLVVARVVPTAAAYGCTRNLELVAMRSDLSCPRLSR
jgi:S1-C subfamily serine protease